MSYARHHHAYHPAVSLPRACPPTMHYDPYAGRCVPWLGPPPQTPRGAIFGVGATAGTAFDCGTVWADADEGGRVGQYIASRDALQATPQCQSDPASCATALAAVNQQISNANYRGGKAADAIRQALNDLGYGPLTLGVAWGGADKAAWTKFTSDNNLPAGPGLVNKAGICKLEEKLGPGGLGRGGMGTWWLVGLIAAGALTVAMVSGRKRTQPATGKAMVPRR